MTTPHRQPDIPHEHSPHESMTSQPSSPGSPDTPELDLSSQEEALRDLLHGAVSDIRPAPGALYRLRREIPERRARRRQALIGAAAVVLLAGAATPAVLLAGNISGSSTTAAEQAAGNGGNGDEGPKAGGWATADGGGNPTAPGADGQGDAAGTATPEQGGSGEPSGAATGGSGTDPQESMAVGSLACARNQLGGGSAAVGTADSNGTVYGSFRVVNISSEACTVNGGGTLTAVARGGADQSRIQVVAHTSGDPATALPDAPAKPVVIQPDQAYVVKFAWVPADSSRTGCSATSGSGGSGDGSAPDSGAGQDGPTAAPAASVELSHTPDSGSPVVATGEVPDACAGTVYRTPAMAEN